MVKIMYTTFIDSNVPHISFYIDEEENEVIIFHKKWDSLLKFSSPFVSLTNEELSAAIDKEMKHLDWSGDITSIYTLQEYRKALMNVPNRLIGE